MLRLVSHKLTSYFQLRRSSQRDGSLLAERLLQSIFGSQFILHFRQHGELRHQRRQRSNCGSWT